MKLYKTIQGIIIEASERFYLSNADNWDAYINQNNIFEVLSSDIQSLTAISWNGEGILATGTGIVPDNDFTLLSGDVVNITIEGIGTLSNEVE